jgi:K+-sensing histidine kinase KdpD
VARSLTAALREGRPVTVPAFPTLADGLFVPRVGTNAFALAARHVDAVVTVKEKFIALAMLRLLECEKVVVEGGPHALRGDPTLLLRALANLVDNAKKHGGGLDHLRVERQGEEVLVTALDRGPGLRPGEEQRVLEPFYGKQENGMLGLGLALVDRIARAHGGRAKLDLAARGDGGRARVTAQGAQLQDPAPGEAQAPGGPDRAGDIQRG